MESTTYRGYGIDHDFYGTDEYSVQYCGDDVMFKTLEDAKAFIDMETEADEYTETFAEIDN